MPEQVPSLSEFKLLQQRILECLDNGLPIQKPNRTRQRLHRNHHPDWAIEWLEVVILLNCSTEARPARTHGLLGKLRRLRHKRGETSRFDEFMVRVDAILHPKSVTPHGYTIPFARHDTAMIFDAMARVAMPLAQLERPVFLYAGALLGYIRSGRLIDHDDDLDFGVYLGDCSISEAGERWLAYKRDLARLGLMTEAACASNSLIFKLKSELPIDVDLFPAWTHGGKFSVYPYSLNALDESRVLPLKDFGQVPLMIPAHPEDVLAQSYGENWRIPDPLFHLNWHAKKREFQEISQVDFSLNPETA